MNTGIPGSTIAIHVVYNDDASMTVNIYSFHFATNGEADILEYMNLKLML